MPQPLKVFERLAHQHVAGCAAAALGIGVSGAAVGALLLLALLVWLRHASWLLIAGAVVLAGVLWAVLSALLIGRLFRRSRERVAFYEDRLDVNWEVLRLSDVASVRTEQGRVTITDTAGRKIRLPDVATAAELLAWFKTRLPPDRIVG